LARLLQGSKPHKSIRFVLFVNEEPPYFQTENMGSLVYARQLRQEHVPVAAMISLETIGFYSDTPGSQKYPPLLGAFYPNHGILLVLWGIRSRVIWFDSVSANFGSRLVFLLKTWRRPATGLGLDGRIIGLFGRRNIQRS
jgi:hypothetical protein